MKKKFLSVVAMILCMLMLLSFVPDAAFAEAENATHYLDINATNFPDAKFRKWIIDNLEHKGAKSSGYYMTKSQVNAVKNINCELCGISSLKGIEKFPELKALWCGGNSISSLDVSKNTKLNDLMCGMLWDGDVCFKNKLTKLDVSKNPDLEWLECDGNKLTTLDLSKNTKLISLYCSYNQFTSLDLSKNTKLQYLACGDNQITKLDLSKQPYLEYVDCVGNGMTTLTLGTKTYLEDIACWDNSLTSLDVSKAPALLELRCDMNKLTALDLSKNTKLKVLFCAENKLTSLDVNKNTKLEDFYCERNRLTSLDLSKNTKLKYYAFYDQTPTAKKGASYSGKYQFDLKALVPIDLMSRVTIVGEHTFSKKTGIVTLSSKVSSLSYYIDPHAPNGDTMDVMFNLSYTTQAKPTISTQPKSKSVAIGSKATFTIAASGGALRYQWYYKSSSTAEWKEISAASGKTKSYSLTAEARHNGYQYKCVIKNLAGKVTSSVITLKTGTAPKITTQPTGKTVAIGKTATFKVAASGSGLSYQWYYRTSSSGSWSAVSAASGKTATYKLTVAERHNGYQYRCKVKNAFGYVYTKTVTLKTGN